MTFCEELGFECERMTKNKESRSHIVGNKYMKPDPLLFMRRLVNGLGKILQ
jgi:hypothetical protein